MFKIITIIKSYILKVVKKYVMVQNLYWLGWKYITYKILVYGYLNNLKKMER